MIDALWPIRGFLKSGGACIDDCVFRVHYQITSILLLAFSLIITARQFVGDPIDCLVSGVPAHVVNSYCWTASTFTLTDGDGRGNDRDKYYHKYYQWVCFVLFFQSASFYATRQAWKACEGGRIGRLAEGLTVVVTADDDRVADRLRALTGYFAKNRRSHDSFALQYAACEALNLINAVAQTWLLDRFLGGGFTTYGIDVFRGGGRWNAREPETADAVARIFPVTAKCAFRNHGPSGTVQEFDALCLLPLNVVNEKIFAFLSVWMIVVVAVSAVGLAGRVAVVVVPTARVVLLKTVSWYTPTHEISKIVEKYRVGNWFLLYQLGKNVDNAVFEELLTELYGEVTARESIELM